MASPFLTPSAHNPPVAAAVRWPFHWATDRAAFEQEMAGLVDQAVTRGARLVALPLHTGTALLGLLTGQAHGDVAAALSHPAAVAALQSCSQDLRRLSDEVFGGLAAGRGVWLVAGSLLAFDDTGYLRHQATVFAPDGRPTGTQTATHRSPSERAWGIRPGDELTPVPTAAGTIGLLVGEDVRYPEVGRILALQGATVLVHLSASVPPGLPARLAGLWREVQANQVFGLEAGLAPGYAAVHCPVEMAPDGRGFLADSAFGTAAAVVVAALDEERRRELLAAYDIRRFFNRGLYERALSVP